jgi:hypothetical protein
MMRNRPDVAVAPGRCYMGILMRHAPPRLALSADLRRWLVVLCAVLMLATGFSHHVAHAAQACAQSQMQADPGDDADPSDEASLSAEHCCACGAALASDHARIASIATDSPVRQPVPDALAPTGVPTDSPPPKSLT